MQKHRLQPHPLGHTGGPTMLDRRSLLLAGGASLLPMLGHAQNAAWPSQAVHIVVPFPPGGTTDNVTRLIGAELGKALGQAVVVDNKPGAGTVIGVDYVAKSVPNGYTLVTVANSFCVNQTLVKPLPYDSLNDLRPVALMGMSEHVLATNPASGLNTVADIVREARAHPGTLSFASFGEGTSAHLAGETLKSLLHVDMLHVPFKGQAPATTALLGNQVSMMFGNWPEFRGLVQDGKLHAVGMATAKRSVFAPSIPTLAEQGATVESNSWNGLLAPAHTPNAVVQRINAEVNKALSAPAVVQAFQQGGIVSMARSSVEFGQFILSEMQRYGAVIRSAGIKQGS